jgi:hypothetical protein
MIFFYLNVLAHLEPSVIQNALENLKTWFIKLWVATPGCLQHTLKRVAEFSRSILNIVVSTYRFGKSVVLETGAFGKCSCSRRFFFRGYTGTLYIQTNSGASVRQRTIPTGRQPLVGEISADFSG